jgi:hypothetical protein
MVENVLLCNGSDHLQIFRLANYHFPFQQSVFSDLGQGVLDNAWQGYNAALFAYGQTGSGKSYSMIGYGANKGIVPITCEQLFSAIERNKEKSKQLQVGGGSFHNVWLVL